MDEEKPLHHEKFLGTLASGQNIVDSRISHLDSHPEVIPYLKEALSKIHVQGSQEIYIEEVKFRKSLGRTNLVFVKPNDEILYAKRINHEGLTKFVKDGKTEKTNRMTVLLGIYDDTANISFDPTSKLCLITAFWGQKAIYEPTDPYFIGYKDNAELAKIYKKSVDFWKKRALVYDPKIIVPGTETKIRPW